MKRTLALVSCMCLALRIPASSAFAQRPDAATLGEEIAGLGTTARVLMIGAHPDDEDTQLIAWLAKARHIEIAYLSLTRGDGGQNLIGNELGPALGMIRTEELLAARRIDGGHQYFTRAYDFGFSKTLEETLEHWPKDSILSDVVSVIRAFRPHVIISVWSGTPADGHGHHQYLGRRLARSVRRGRRYSSLSAESVVRPRRLGAAQVLPAAAQRRRFDARLRRRRVFAAARRVVLRRSPRKAVRSTARRDRARCRARDPCSAACTSRFRASRT